MRALRHALKKIQEMDMCVMTTALKGEDAKRAGPRGSKL